MRRCTLRLLVCLLCLGVGATSAFAQLQTGEITGRVTDSSGAVLPGVAVTATGPALLQPLTATSAESGAFRFPNVPIGEYSVRFELSGFKTVVQQGVRITIGFTAQVNASLGISAVEEVVTITSEAPLVDTSSPTRGATYTQEALQSVPSGRDPWVMLERTPGITMDRTNVGGSQSGQQSNFVSRGATTTQNKWMIDGVDVTDMAATGATPVYFDFDAFEEMQVSTGGIDASQQTGGVGINIVTKSGTDRFKGSGRYYITDEQFEANNVTREIQQQGAGSGAPVQRNLDYGFEVGGPIKRGRAWFWGGYGKQDIKVGVVGFYKADSACRALDPLSSDPVALRQCLNTDLTVLNNYNMKAQVTPFRSNKFTWHSYFADKTRNARGASDTRPIETTSRQAGPVWTHKFGDQHIFTDRWMLDVQFAYVGGGFILDFNQDSLSEVQPLFDINTSKWSRSSQLDEYDRPATSFDVTSNYFLPAKLGGDHAFSVGFKWRDTPQTYNYHFGGNAQARVRNGVATEATLWRDSNQQNELTTTSVYVQDKYTKGRMVMSLGFRVDHQDDSVGASSVPAHPFLPEFLPGIDFPGADSGVTWTDISPRIGFNFDLSGTGRTVARASYARYYSQLGPAGLSSPLNPVTAASVTFPWNDINGDLFVQRNELDTTRIIASSGNYDPRDPLNVSSKNTVDPDLKNETTDEFITGFDHQIGSSVAVSVSYIYRKYDNFRRDWNGLTPSRYTLVPGFVETGCDGPCPPVDYYKPNPGVVVSGLPTVRSNTPDFYRNFNGIELSFDKRMSNRWMVSSSFSYNNAKQYYESDRAYTDPTNIENLHNAQYAPESTGSGIDNVYINAKWLYKLAGVYQLPWDINLAGFYNARQGYPFLRGIQVNDTRSGAGRPFIYLESQGEERLPTLQTIDFRVAKRFQVQGVRFEASMDVFNLTNSNTVLARRRQQNSTTSNDISGIVAPRIARFGVRVMF